MKNYHVKTSKIENAPGTWNSTLVEIYLDDEKIGEYIRNYPSHVETTFHPFEQNGKDYALYSKDYTATRVMELPSCKDICGEERNGYGFCPVEYYVPENSWTKEDLQEYKEFCDKGGHKFDINKFNGQFGFVAGCVWGDDSRWKIQFLDLSKISEGVLIRDDRFGYIELGNNLHLKDVIDLTNYEEGSSYIEISTVHLYKINGEQL